MVEFLTLFLGLVAGPQEIAVSVSDEVSRVELRLDHELVAELRAPDWKGDLDFGARPAPRWLEAVAFDATGRELARTRQALNVPRPTAEASLLVRREQNDAARYVGQLVWEDALGGRLSFVDFALDSRPYEVERPERFPLPDPGTGRASLLEADLAFSSGTEASAQTVYGAPGLEVVGAELTAVPLRSRRRASAAQLERYLLGPDGTLDVVGTEREASSLIVVKGDGVSDALLAMNTPFGDPDEHSSSTPVQRTTLTYTREITTDAAADAPNRRWTALPFPPRQSLVVMRPYARQRTGRSVDLELFAVSPSIARPKGGLLWLLNTDVEVPGLDPTVRLADAVAVAGLKAAEHNRRRAVLVVLETVPQDGSRIRFDAALEYLASLGVPVHVWQLVEDPREELVHPSAQAIRTYRQLRRAYEELQADFSSQRTAWVAGRYLPHEIDLAAGAPFTLLADRADGASSGIR